MKKLLAFAVVAVVGLSTAVVFAGEGCGAAKADKPAGCCMAGAAKSGACTDMFSKLNLTDSQKAQIENLKDSTKRATSTSEAHAMFNEGLAKILTPDQMAQFKAQCDKSKASGECPMMKSQKKS